MTASATQLAAVIFDWAGTIVDFGSRAPMGAFVRAFRHFDVEISVAEAREPMGLPKRDHIREVLAQPRIAAAWKQRHGQTPDEGAIDAVYGVFVPMNAAVVADYSDLIPGAVETVTALRERGLKIGSTTGYTREIMDRLLPHAAARGYAPDNLVCAGDLPAGRPTPLMMYKTFLDLGVWPAWACIKVDDTEPGIEEGVAAATWTVGLAVSGNAVGLSQEEWSALDDDNRQRLRSDATKRLTGAGAHFVVDTVADLLPVVNEIEVMLGLGERPWSR